MACSVHAKQARPFGAAIADPAPAHLAPFLTDKRRPCWTAACAKGTLVSGTLDAEVKTVVLRRLQTSSLSLCCHRTVVVTPTPNLELPRRPSRRQWSAPAVVRPFNSLRLQRGAHGAGTGLLEISIIRRAPLAAHGRWGRRGFLGCLDRAFGCASDVRIPSADRRFGARSGTWA
jgi:hypothetical protein